MSKTPEHDLLIRRVRVVRPHGNVVHEADIAVKNGRIVKVAPGEFWGWAGGAVAEALNWKQDRATTAGIVVGQSVPADSRIPLDPKLFTLQRLTQGK